MSAAPRDPVRTSPPDLTVKSFTVPQPTLAQLLSESIGRLQHELGGKVLAGYFDGREGAEVAESTISRWKSEPRRFPAIFLPTLLELDPVFRREVLRLLMARLVAPAELLDFVAEKDPRAAATLAQAHEEIIRRVLFGPGGRGEGYS